MRIFYIQTENIHMNVLISEFINEHEEKGQDNEIRPCCFTGKIY